MQHVGGLEQALQALKDIHMPAVQPWWQFPIGIWLLIGFASVVVLLSVFAWPSLLGWLQQRRRKKGMCKLVQQQMQQIQEDYAESKDAVQLVAELSALLRRVSITVFEKEHVEGIIEEPWLQFLDSKWSENRPKQSFTHPSMADLLNTAGYRRNLSHEMLSAVSDLIGLCQSWLEMVEKRYV
ncbi:MAG: DUF4381 domain-containing protein [Mariprofundaceae bacterium]